MLSQDAARQIQRYASEAIEGLRTQGATADTEHHLVDIRTLAGNIEEDLQDEKEEQPAEQPTPTEPPAVVRVAETIAVESADDTKLIQAAINKVSESKPGSGVVSEPAESESKPDSGVVNEPEKSQNESGSGVVE